MGRNVQTKEQEISMNNKFFTILIGVLLISLMLTGVVYAQQDLGEPGEFLEGTGDDLEDDAVCSGEVIHPVLNTLAVEYEVGYEDLLFYFCEQEIGVGEIEHALATAALEEVEETYDVLLTWLYEGGMDWGEIWQELGLIGTGAFDSNDDDEGEDEDDEEEGDDESDDIMGLSLVCSLEMEHPVLLRFAEDFGVDYETLLSYFCEDHFGIGEIKHALKTAENESVDKTWEELLDEREGEEDKSGKSGWGEIWRKLGLFGKNKDEQEMDGADLNFSNKYQDTFENRNEEKYKNEKPENHPGRGTGLNKKP